MSKSDKKSDQLIVFIPQEKLFLESKHDVLLLLQHLAESQETTVKLILGRLYDVGADNLITNKIPFLPLKKILKVVIGLIGILGGGITWIVYNTNHPPLSELPTNIPTIIQPQ